MNDDTRHKVLIVLYVVQIICILGLCTLVFLEARQLHQEEVTQQEIYQQFFGCPNGQELGNSGECVQSGEITATSTYGPYDPILPTSTDGKG